MQSDYEKCLILLGMVLLLSHVVYGSRILGISIHPGKSHFDFFRPLFLGLARAGHDVHVVSYFPNKEPVKNYTDYELKGMPILSNVVDIQEFEGQSELEFFPIKLGTFFLLYGWGIDSCKVGLNSPHIQKMLTSNSKFDLVIMEQFNNDCMMAVAHKLRAPVVAISSCAPMPWHYRRFGSPMVLSHMPVNFLPHNEKMSFLQRVNNILHFHVLNALYDYITQPATNALLREHFDPTIPSIEEMVKSTSLMLLNQHYSLAGAYPYPPNVVEVGGLHIQPAKPLEANLQTLLDNSPSKGVVYISWGSMVRPETLSAQKRDDLLRVIAQFSGYLFLMKWPAGNLTSKPVNLFTRDWMPQRDILCHPKVRAFMTHGGLLGTSEGVYCGVPMIVTPFFGDQFLNARAISNRKLGVVLNFKDLNQDNIANALNTILTPSFMEGARRVSDAYRNRPMKPLDLAIWWVEETIRTGGLPLAQSSSIEMSSLVLHSIDVYVLLAFLAVMLALMICTIMKFTLRILRNAFDKRKKKVE